MEKRLILRGFGVGALGGLLAFLFARIMAEPVIQSSINYESGRDAMERILALAERPTAMMCSNDMTAIGALRALRDRGCAVPKEMSIVGLDDIELSDIVYPPLTTLHTSRTELARLVYASLEHSNKQAPVKGRQYMLHAKLVIRKSTGPVLRSTKSS